MIRIGFTERKSAYPAIADNSHIGTIQAAQAQSEAAALRNAVARRH